MMEKRSHCKPTWTKRRRLSAHWPPETTRQHWNSGHCRMRMLSMPDALDVAPRRRNHWCQLGTTAYWGWNCAAAVEEGGPRGGEGPWAQSDDLLATGPRSCRPR